MKKTKYAPLSNFRCRLTGHQVEQQSWEYMNNKQCSRCGESDTDDKYILQVSPFSYRIIEGKYDRYGLTQKIGYLFYWGKESFYNFYRKQIFFRFPGKDLPF